MSSALRIEPGTLVVPAIETERLMLRGHRPSDFPQCLAMWTDPAVVRYIGGKPFAREEVWSRLLRYAGHWVWMRFGYWAIEEKSSGGFVGELGFANFKREIEPSLEGIPELGWALASAAHGQGYASEAIRAAVQWGDAHFSCKKTACIIHPDNLPSIRVAEKSGYREVQKTTYKGQSAILFARESGIAPN